MGGNKSKKYGKTFATILRKVPRLPDVNPLSYIAMTNFYKYVTIDRKSSRRGDFDRIFIDREKEVNLFLSEVEVLNPNVVFFQSKGFQNLDGKIKDVLLDKDKGIKVYYAYHPSYYGKADGNVPEIYFSERTSEMK